MLSNFPQAHGCVRPDAALLVSRLKSSEMAKHLNVQIVVVKLWREVDDRLHRLLSDCRVRVEEAMRDLRKYLVVDDGGRQMMHEQLELLEEPRSSDSVGRCKQLDNTWHNFLLIFNFVEKSP